MKKSTISTFDALFPLLAIGITILLLIAIIRGYVTTYHREAVVVLPGGVTYTGQ